MEGGGERFEWGYMGVGWGGFFIRACGGWEGKGRS